MENFKLIIYEPTANSKLILLLRKYSGRPMSEVKQALATGIPVVDISPHPNQYDEFIQRTRQLLDELEANTVDFRCIVDDLEEDLQYVRKAFQLWEDIGDQIAEKDNLKYGDDGGG